MPTIDEDFFRSCYLCKRNHMFNWWNDDKHPFLKDSLDFFKWKYKKLQSKKFEELSK